MKQFFMKPYRWAILCSVLIIGSFIYIMLDTFVIAKSYEEVVGTKDNQTNNTSQLDNTTVENSISEENDSNGSDTSAIPSDAVITDNSYDDGNIKITIETIREYDSNIYVADVQLSDPSYLKTALAGNKYGRNIKDTTSNMAADNGAILAINGDFYGFRNYGYVLRNGVLYRDTAEDTEDLVIDTSGNFSIIQEDKTDLNSLDMSNIWQIFSFGSALLENSDIVVNNSSKVDREMSSNPRTAIGQIDSLHYIVVVSDGRTSESAGLSLLELANVMSDLGCITAYNLDGGGSATMYFNGEVVNNPTDGRKSGEREVSDIVYFGY